MSCVFCCISQRALYGHLLALTDAPQNDPAAAMLHGVIRDIWYKLYDDPALLSLSYFEDESYPWNVVNNRYPELDAKYKDIFKTIYEFWRFLQGISLHGENESGMLFISKETAAANKVSYKPAYRPLLEAVGFNPVNDKTGVRLSHLQPETVSALKRLAATSLNRAQASQEAQEAVVKSRNLYEYVVRGLSLYDFMRCSFDGKWEYIINRIDYEQGMQGLLTDLAVRCRNTGYTLRIHPECNASSTSSFGIDFMRGAGGFHITYNPRKTQKFGFGTRNGIGEKKMLENFSSLDADMQQHFINICRPCNLCMGCTKGGKNKPFTVNVVHNGAEHALCPQFPQHEWETFTPELIDTLFRYHELQETYVK